MSSINLSPPSLESLAQDVDLALDVMGKTNTVSSSTITTVASLVDILYYGTIGPNVTVVRAHNLGAVPTKYMVSQVGTALLLVTLSSTSVSIYNDNAILSATSVKCLVIR